MRVGRQLGFVLRVKPFNSVWTKIGGRTLGDFPNRILNRKVFNLVYGFSLYLRVLSSTRLSINFEFSALFPQYDWTHR